MAENKNAQQVREITDKLEQGIKELFESERFKEYLRTMSKFYNYSFNNTLLIAMQKPLAIIEVSDLEEGETTCKAFLTSAGGIVPTIVRSVSYPTLSLHDALPI